MTATPDTDARVTARPTSEAAPLVTIGIPVFNGEAYLEAALRSAQAQDHPHLEIVISDNGSTDGTVRIAAAATATDPRVRYVRSETNRGGPWNYDNVVRHARGSYFAFLAADDVILPGFVSACVRRLEAEPGLVMAFPRTQLIDADGVVFETLNDAGLDLDQPTPHERIARFLQAQAAHVMYGVIRTGDLRRTRGLRPVVGSDLVLLVELACRGGFGLVPEQLFHQRRHAQQFSAQGGGQTGWHAPRGRARLKLPQTRSNLELLIAAVGSDLPVVERWRCAVATLRWWILPRWRAMPGDVWRLLGLPARSGRS